MTGNELREIARITNESANKGGEGAVEIKEESRNNGAEMKSKRRWSGKWSGNVNDSETIDRNDASFQRVATQRVAA